MPRTTVTPEPKSKHKTARARELARQAADRYFAALAAEIPYDHATGDVSLIDAVTNIQHALLEDGYPRRQGFEEGSAMDAGYLLGVEVGRRMAGGAR